MAFRNEYTGKPEPSRWPKPNGGTCDECGTETIDRCLVCGAPQCCPKCCAEATAEMVCD